MSKESSPWIETCPECGAESWSDSDGCWLCGRRPDGTHAEQPAAAGAEATATATSAVNTGTASTAPPRAIGSSTRIAAPHAPQQFSFSLATMLLITTLAAIWLALLASAPGLAISACILLLPALVRTSLVIKKRAGRTVSSGEKVALFASSLLASTVVVVVALVASVGTFCAVCLGVASATNSNFRGDLTMAFLTAGVTAFVTTVVAGRLLSKWVRRRYRRDIGES